MSSAPPREIVRVEIRDPNVRRLLDESGDVRRLESLEAETIRFALSHYRGQMSEMARRLGIGRSTLYRKMKGYGLNDLASDLEHDDDTALTRAPRFTDRGAAAHAAAA